MKMTNHQSQTYADWPAQNLAGLRKLVCPTTSLIFAIAFALLAASGTICAQTVVGSPGAGFQTWTAADLNDNDSPFWDTQFGASQPNDEGSPAEKNVGFCLTSSGDCQGIGSALFAPGTLPFWGTAYDSVHDSGGQLDPKVYFKASSGEPLKATLMLNNSANPGELNEFGWFETNATATFIGTKHRLFLGSPNPSVIGSAVTFQPTQYFGFYYADYSEGYCDAYTLFSFNDPNCFGSHNFVVFLQKSKTQSSVAQNASSDPIFWIAAEDPQECGTNDGDCNVTLVKVAPNN